MKKSPPGGAAGKKPPPTPQRNSSIKADSSAEYKEARARLENLVRPGVGSGSGSSGSSSSPVPAGPPAPPKPGKLNLSHLPPGLQAKVGKADFPSPPPPENDYPFPPPPPPDNNVPLPPPPPLPADLLGNAPSSRVAVVNPQPQSISSSSSPNNIWSAGRASLKKTPPPTLARRSNGNVPVPSAMEVHRSMSPQGAPPLPASPKSGGGSGGQPNFLEDLHRTLRRKSGSRQGSLEPSLVPVGSVGTTMDDMALPPPPPELLDQQGNGHNGNGYSSGNISGYATLRRGPPPAPPKRGDGTKLT